ncbi:hypothetical protein BBJ28_00022091 [Nothophytophthora sp. Chile5]|nr:hypothetical protein BBJ28_00022091 [Nothophytophthora sp. Chile5]
MSTRGRRVLTPLPPRAGGDLGKLASRRDSNEDENQVVPFSLEGDDDDGDTHDVTPQDSNKPRPIFERRSTSNLEKEEQGRPRTRENAWDQESDGSAYSSDEDSDVEDDEKDGNHLSHEEPESPSRRKRQSQQSEEEDDDSDGDSDDGAEDDSEEESTRLSSMAISQPVSATAATTVDLSRLSKLAVFPGTDTHLVQGHILRVKTMLTSQYHYYINGQLLLMAEKQRKNRTSNYHVFDMTRSAALSSKPTKKSGNYIGKLRSNFSKKKNVLVGNFSRKTELGAIIFGGSSNASEPRRLTVILPPLSKRQEIEGLTVGDSSSSFSMLIDLYKSMTDDGMAVAHSPLSPGSLIILENKEPVFENGFYRLNFNGRVSVPSVKNFQLVRAQTGTPTKNSDRPVFLQFGKVDDKKFHLDFRAPLTPIQAFATALAQFNL